jgi:nitrate reductase beta subunit
MATVYNWQLKKEIIYKYEESRPEKQIAWVFDTNKCIACQTCTMACKTTWTCGKGEEYMFWNNVESRPYGFYPLAWDVKLLDRLGAQKWDGDKYAGQTIFDAGEEGEELLGHTPEDRDWAHPNIGEDEVITQIEDGAYFNDLPHLSWMFYLARICNHCTYPGCLAACPRKAIYKREEDGIVLIDQERCRGYRKCVKGCPYKKAMFNPVTGRSEKCIACYPAVENGIKTRCVENCIGKIRIVSWLRTPDKAREDSPIDYLVHIKKAALPLYPQFGTEPNVYYIPPVHVDVRYLRQMFGPGVESAIKTYRSNDETLTGLIKLFGSTDRIIETFRVENGNAIGFAGGQEIIRVPVKEPFIVRDFHDKELDVYRHSVT